MEIRYKKILFILLAIVIFTIITYSLFLINHQQIENGKVTKVYFADNISPAHQELINKFNKEFADRIEVVPINLPFSKFTTNERKELLARALRSKSDRIDIFSVDLIWVSRFARWAEPLDLYFPSMERENILDQAISSCYSNGKLVALPLYLDVGLIYYRDDILRSFDDYDLLNKKIRESLTWSEFIEISQRIQDKYPFTYLFAADNFEGLVCNYLELLYGQEGSIFESDSVQLKTPVALNALNLMIDMIYKHKIVPKEVTSFHENECYLYALENEVPFFKGWPGLNQQYHGWTPYSEKLMSIKIAPLPHFEGFNSLSVFGGWNLMVPKDSNNKAEAVEFIKFVLKPENQLILYEKSGFLPVSELVYKKLDDKIINSDLQFYREIIDRGFHRPFLIDYTKISDIISYYIHLSLINELTAEQALTQATRLINSNQVLIK
jgi:multiple sugar transport system substrate-binding protein